MLADQPRNYSRNYSMTPSESLGTMGGVPIGTPPRPRPGSELELGAIYAI